MNEVLSIEMLRYKQDKTLHKLDVAKTELQVKIPLLQNRSRCCNSHFSQQMIRFEKITRACPEHCSRVFSQNAS